MADEHRRGPADGHSAADSASTVISTVGEEIVRIVAPVSACMLLVVLLVTALSTSSSSQSPLSLIFSSGGGGGAGDPSLWDNLKSALIDSLAFIAVVTALTFLLVLLFYFRCSRFLKAYMAFSSFVVLAFLGGEISLLLLKKLSFPIDFLTFSLLLYNLSVVGVLAVFMSRIPIVVAQGYLILIGVLVAYWFTMLPEWTTWALLAGMAVYDLAAVLLPGGPLRLLLELAISRDEQIPALVYEARPVNYLPGGGAGGERRGLWRRNSSTADSSNSSSRSPASGMRAPLIQHLRASTEEEVEEGPEEGIGLGSSGAIKLGLGDFIFYSVLVGRAALCDFMTVYAGYLAIVAGLGVTLLLLGFYRKALPALPVSIALGLLFYALTRLLLEIFVFQFSINLLMF